MEKEWKWWGFYCVTICSVILSVKWGSHAVTVLSENQMAERRHCVVIDPGHGGEDGGAISRSGIPESTYNLEISERINDLLNLLGYDTKMIRTSDISVYTKGETLSQKKSSDLKERVRMINETEGALLLSIHQNHFSDEKYSGAQVFYSGTKDSDVLAKQLQTALISSLNSASNRKIKRSSGVYLMEHIHCPGVLIECGFLSNSAEEAMLKDSEYQKKISCVIAAITSQYLSNT